MTDAASGSSLGVIDPLRLSILDAVEIITRSQQRVMAILAPMIGEDLQGFVEPDVIGSPPMLEAYAAYREGERLFKEEDGVSEDAVELFRRAAQLDITWALPLMRMHAAAIPFRYGGRRPGFNVGALLDSIQTTLEGMQATLSSYEHAWVESKPGRHNVPLTQSLPA